MLTALACRASSSAASLARLSFCSRSLDSSSAFSCISLCFFSALCLPPSASESSEEESDSEVSELEESELSDSEDPELELSELLEVESSLLSELLESELEESESELLELASLSALQHKLEIISRQSHGGFDITTDLKVASVSI